MIKSKRWDSKGLNADTTSFHVKDLSILGSWYLMGFWNPDISENSSLKFNSIIKPIELNDFIHFYNPDILVY